MHDCSSRPSLACTFCRSKPKSYDNETQAEPTRLNIAITHEATRLPGTNSLAKQQTHLPFV